MNNSDDFEGEKENHDDSITKGTGSTLVVTDSLGTISPLIFLRKRVVLEEGDDEMDEGINIEIAYAIRTLVLLHELGHADDIEKLLDVRTGFRRDNSPWKP